MIPWWWLIPAVMLGALMGFFILALVNMNRED